MIDPKIRAAVEAAVEQGLEAWLDDGRESIRAAFQAIPTLRASMIRKVRESAEWQGVITGLNDAEDEADAVEGAIATVQLVLGKLAAGGLSL